MKKILVGVCGIGNGHMNRQLMVIKHLLQAGHHVVVATTEDNVNFFKDKINNISVVPVIIPWITCNTNGIDFSDTLNRYENNNIDLFQSFLNFSIRIEKEFNGVPDLVITDYEPNVAQYSYAVDIPLICMEQQSKFLFLKEQTIKNFSIMEEKKRINYFFPKYYCKIISSFFPIDTNDKRIRVVNPIISELKCTYTGENRALVYFSPYGFSEDYEIILKAISEIKDVKFDVYTKFEFKDYKTCSNIFFKKFNDSFKRDLEKSKFVISTCGHQLISEALSVEKPLYLFPLQTYEQNYNGLMVEKYKLGRLANNLTKDEIIDFYSKLDYYCQNIINYKKNYYKNSWKIELDRIINSI